MFSALLRHKIILVVGVIVALGGAWYALTSSSAPQPDIVNTPSGASGGDQFLQTLETLRSLSIDTTIFSDPVFLSLQDFSTQIVPEPVGRTDPFAPLSQEAQATPQSTQSATIFQSH